MDSIDVMAFWGKVDRTGGPDACWPWTGAREVFGYGATSKALPHKTERGAHRIAYYLAKGDIPRGLIVRHKCDNPPCCNPEHLELGTHADNARDREERGRAGWQRKYREG